ncbi:insulinase family protein [bacterium]|nr:insulinase family protein [bacterium]
MALKRHAFIVLLLLAATFAFAANKAAPSVEIDIPYEKFTLDNGLTLLVHEDHKAPIVAVNVWYHVGSKNEKPGKTGFAHLFEHLMFNGSENFNNDYFQAMEAIGATDLNGTTSEDRTNYFQNVPTSALDLALWMESDRMGHLLGAVDQAKLDEQRGVVQNEKRQYENEPYAVSEELITQACFQPGHPYSWTVIGSMEDLDAAKLNDVHEWFKAFYGPSNAVLVVAGDVTPETAFEKVKRYFGDIPPGPPVSRHSTWIAKRSGEHRQIAEDRVPQARLYKVWNMPEWGSKDGTYLDLVSDVLASGKTSRLYKRLVYEDQIATSVSAFIDIREIAGLFQIIATVKPGVEIAAVEKAVNEELAKLLEKGPTEAEVKRVKTQYVAGFVRGIERIGGFGGKSDILAQNFVFAGDPGHYKVTLKTVQNLTGRDLHDAARRWLSDGAYTLEIRPFPELSAAEKSDVDRTKLPVPSEQPDASFPVIEKGRLSNGLNIMLARRTTVPVVNLQLIVNAGYASDMSGLPGTARLAMDMLDEGTKKRTALQISEELAGLGSGIGTGSDLDMSVVRLNTLKQNLDASLDIFADVVLNPVFPEADFKRLQAQTLAGIQREKVTPIQMALRVFPGLLYGREHAYGNPLTGSGNEASVAKMTAADLVRFHQTWFKPGNATLVAVGDITLAELQPRLEKLFAAWPSGAVPEKNIATVNHKPGAEIYLIDRPGSQQSIVFCGHVAPPNANPDELAMQVLNSLLGGDFTSRINMNLREDKHWTYGAGSFLVDARGQRPFIVYSSVQSDKTADSMREIVKEMSQVISDRPVTPAEFEKARNNQVLQLAGQWETGSSVSGSIGDIVRYGYPENHFITYAERLRKLTTEDANRAGKTLLHPDKMVWVVVGDRSKIEADLNGLGWAKIQLMDADGNPVQ